MIDNSLTDKQVSSMPTYTIDIDYVNRNEIKLVLSTGPNHSDEFLILTGVLDDVFIDYLIDHTNTDDPDAKIVSYCQFSSIFPDQVAEVIVNNKITTCINFSRNDLYGSVCESDDKELSILSTMSIIATIGIFYKLHKVNIPATRTCVATLRELASTYKLEKLIKISDRVQNGIIHHYINIFSPTHDRAIKNQICERISNIIKIADNKDAQNSNMERKRNQEPSQI